MVVTQRFHMARALYDARRAGLDATGFAADRRPYGRVLRRLQMREAAARVKTMGDVVTGADRYFLGARIPLSRFARHRLPSASLAGDGRASWGD